MAISNGYTTLVEVKNILRLTDSIDDALLETCIESASRQIDTHCERVFTSSTGTRVYTPRDSYTCEIDDLVSLTSLESSTDGDSFDVTWGVNDYQLMPLNGYVGGLQRPYDLIGAIGDLVFTTLGIEATVRVTGTFGWSAVPTDIRQACNLIAIRQYKRYDSPLGVAGFGDLGAIRVSRFDPDVETLLSPYRKLRFA
jgi:hypothetical protein